MKSFFEWAGEHGLDHGRRKGISDPDSDFWKRPSFKRKPNGQLGNHTAEAVMLNGFIEAWLDEESWCSQ